MSPTEDHKHHFERPTMQSQDFPFVRRLAYLLVIVAVGLFTGALGFALLAMIYMPGYSTPLVQSRLLNGPLVTMQPDTTLEPAVAAGIQDHMVGVVKHRQRGGTKLDQLPEPADYVATGVVVTSDGWIMATGITGDPAGYDVYYDGAFYALKQTQIDAYTGVVFARIDARNLNPVEMYADIPQSGTALIHGALASYSEPSLGLVRISQSIYFPARSKADLVHTSSELSSYMQLDVTFNDAKLGHRPFFDQQGRLIGLSVTKSNQQVLIPTAHLNVSLGQLLRKQSERDLGITYSVNTPVPGRGESRGIIVGALGKSPSIKPKSRAEKSGIAQGDAIIAVNGTQIDALNPFDVLWRRNQQNTTITLSVIRNNKESQIEVSL